MTKEEAIVLMKEKRQQGYITHEMLLDFYEDNEELPEGFFELACHRLNPPKPYQIVVSPKVYDELNKLLNDTTTKD